MKSCTRRAGPILMGLGAIVVPGLLLAEGPPSQPVQPRNELVRPVAPQAAFFAPSLTLTQDARFRKRLEALDDYIRAAHWPEAISILQGMLDSPEDAFLAVAHGEVDGKEAVRWTSVRAEADRLLASLSAEGLREYESAYGETSRGLLSEARRKNDPELLARLTQRYFHTAAGIEAAHLLAVHHLDRGRFVMAAHCYRRLLQRGTEFDPATLFQAAVAFQGAGETEEVERVWVRLAARGADGVDLGEEKVPLADLRQELDRYAAASFGLTGLRRSPVFRGDVARSGAGASGAPTLEARWKTATIVEPVAVGWMQYAVRQRENHREPVLPGAVPLVVGDRAIIRTQRGVEAFDLASGRQEWAAPFEGSLDSLAADPQRFGYANNWVGAYLGVYPDALFENSTIGTLSADAARVYAVEDLAVPPYLAAAYGILSQPGKGLSLSFAPALAGAAEHSSLRAIDLDTGKLLWEAGGLSTPGRTTSPLDNTYFLGPPLPLGGRLYVLTEKAQDLRLVCLLPESGKVEWVQALGSVKDRLLVDPGRRLRAAPLAYGQGLLLCPTNVGGIVAVDVLTHSLVWAHAYREPEPPREIVYPQRGRGRVFSRLEPPPLPAHWKLAAPLVQGDRVLLAPPDAPGLHCLRLRDGKLLWKIERGPEDLYLAGVAADRVLLVGKQSCRALALEDGREVWNLETGIPSGLGMFEGTSYYLPIRQAVDEKDPKPLLCVVDVEKGILRERIPVVGQQPLGNLVWGRERLLSQTVFEAAAFPIGKARTDVAASPPEVRSPAAVDLSPHGIESLVRRLGNTHYEEREQATRALQAAGPAALEVLRRACRASDPEVRHRAVYLTARLERQAETAHLLEPRRVRLACKDTPLPEVVADLARQTGFQLELQGDAAKFAKRKLTLDTGETTFWEALDQLCRQADLVERRVEADPGERPAVYGDGVRVKDNHVVIWDTSRGSNPYADQNGKVVLTDGKPRQLVTRYAGAVRIRVVALSASRSGEHGGGSDVVLTLEATPEPRMQWQKILAVRVEKAVDDKGLTLEPQPEPVQDVPFYPPGRRGGMLVGGVPLTQAIDEAATTGNPRQVTLRLGARARLAEKLHELSGTIAAQVQTPPQPLLVVDDVLKAKDRVVHSPAGGTLRIVAVERQDDGSIKIRAHLGAPPRRVDSGAGPVFEGVLFLNGQALGEVEESVAAGVGNFSLTDRKGEAISLERGTNVELLNTGRYTQDFDLTFRPQPGQAEAARLTFRGWRLVLVDVPFTLKDIPMP